MPDISMCNNNFCSLKETCYRYKATPSKRQSYTNFKQNEAGYCEYYVKFIEYKKENKNI